VTEEKLNLFEFPSCLMAEPGAKAYRSPPYDNPQLFIRL
jgi:hypothetical protein